MRPSRGAFKPVAQNGSGPTRSVWSGTVSHKLLQQKIWGASSKRRNAQHNLASELNLGFANVVNSWSLVACNTRTTESEELDSWTWKIQFFLAKFALLTLGQASIKSSLWRKTRADYVLWKIQKSAFIWLLKRTNKQTIQWLTRKARPLFELLLPLCVWWRWWPSIVSRYYRRWPITTVWLIDINLGTDWEASCAV